MLSSSAPWSPGTSALHRSGSPWSLKSKPGFFRWIRFFITLPLKTLPQGELKYFTMHQYSFDVGISHYMSGLYCLKLDHFQTRAESIYILIYINSHFKVFAKVLILVEFLDWYSYYIREDLFRRRKLKTRKWILVVIMGL